MNEHIDNEPTFLVTCLDYLPITQRSELILKLTIEKVINIGKATQSLSDILFFLPEPFKTTSIATLTLQEVIDDSAKSNIDIFPRILYFFQNRSNNTLTPEAIEFLGNSLVNIYLVREGIALFPEEQHLDLIKHLQPSHRQRMIKESSWYNNVFRSYYNCAYHEMPQLEPLASQLLETLSDEHFLQFVVDDPKNLSEVFSSMKKDFFEDLRVKMGKKLAWLIEEDPELGKTIKPIINQNSTDKSIELKRYDAFLLYFIDRLEGPEKRNYWFFSRSPEQLKSAKLNAAKWILEILSSPDSWKNHDLMLHRPMLQDGQLQKLIDEHTLQETLHLNTTASWKQAK